MAGGGIHGVEHRDVTIAGPCLSTAGAELLAEDPRVTRGWGV
jgi:hypothetical protein